MDLAGIDGIAQIMTLPVFHIGDQALWLTQSMADQFHNVNIAHLVVTADVIDLPCPAFANNQIDRLAVILYIEPIPDIQPLAIDR